MRQRGQPESRQGDWNGQHDPRDAGSQRGVGPRRSVERPRRGHRIGLLWIPVIQGARGLCEYLHSMQAYLAPPIAAVFFLGGFKRRLNAAGCLAALLIGFALGVVRLAVDTPVSLRLAGFEVLGWIMQNAEC